MLYSQRTNTDCLIASLENLLDIPRSLFPPVEYYNRIGKDFYPTYKWLGQVLSERGKYRFEHRFNSAIRIENKWTRSLLGLYHPNSHYLHAVYQNYDKFFDAYGPKYIDLYDYEIIWRISEHHMEDLKELYIIDWHLRMKLDKYYLKLL